MPIRNTTRNPFAKCSAEEELAYIDEIFYEPDYYQELKQLLSEGNSRFLLGQRGQGKSMLIHKLFSDLSKNHTLALLITRYDGIPVTNNESHLLVRIIQALVFGVTKHLYLNPKHRAGLTEHQQGKLALFIELFYESYYSNEFIENANEIRRIKTRNIFARIWNERIVAILNGVLNGAVAVTTDLIRKSAGLDSANIDVARRDYVKEIPVGVIQSLSLDQLALWNKAKLIDMLNFMVKCCHDVGYGSVVILFDKIDEYSDISDDIEKVTDFTIEILRDTDLLLNNNMAIVFSLWSEVKRSLNRQKVRFDKFPVVDIRWDFESMAEMMNARLTHYSKDKSRPLTMATLVKDKLDRTQILELSEQSPRSLIRLLAEISSHMTGTEEYDEFTKEAISKGILSYCKNFDYESVNPAKLGGRDDLISWINKLLRIKSIEFTIEDVKRTFAIAKGTASTHIETLIKIGLIKDNHNEVDGNPVYYVVDSRIRHMIARSVGSIEDV